MVPPLLGKLGVDYIWLGLIKTLLSGIHIFGVDMIWFYMSSVGKPGKPCWLMISSGMILPFVYYGDYDNPRTGHPELN